MPRAPPVTTPHLPASSRPPLQPALTVGPASCSSAMACVLLYPRAIVHLRPTLALGGGPPLRASTLLEPTVSVLRQPSPPTGSRGQRLLDQPIHEGLLTALLPVIRCRPEIAAVRLHGPGVSIGSQLQIEHCPQPVATGGVLDRHEHLDPTLQISLHAVGGANKVFLAAGISKIIGA